MKFVGLLAAAAAAHSALGLRTHVDVDAATHVQAGPWPNVCVSGKGYSAWNETRCDSSATCCANEFSGSGQGCCPFKDAVCCPGGLQCCPSGTTCVYQTGTSYNTVYQCQVNSVNVTTSLCSCKPGPVLPFSTSLKNVLIIGDSVSIGYTPFVNQALADIAMVQHAPWDVSDGGAEETAYGLQCLKYFLASPSGMDITPDVVMFNWGLHDGPMSNLTTPGQNGNSSVYSEQLMEIAARLKSWAAPKKAQLLFALTSPMICNVSHDGCVVANNNNARDIMVKLGIPTISLHDAVVAKCGPAPQASCFNETGCFCPHCVPAGYEWLAQSTIAPAIRGLLQGTAAVPLAIGQGAVSGFTKVE